MPSSLSEVDLNTLFPFQLDDFQKEAIAALDAGRSVVVCSPTGSGKTLVGEYAIYRALTRRGRVFYTTPLKALSNQKLRDFRNKFGADMVGLLTGDLSVNREAPILVMTTEIFRNMLYGTSIGAVGTSLTGVEAVVLDECHYMNDRQRGTVWEESIIYCPPEIQLVALSATVANSDQLTDWVRKVHGPTELIHSDFRPVPLQFHFGSTKGLFPLLIGQQGKMKMNPRLKSQSKGRLARQEGQNRMRETVPTPGYILSHLAERDMLPAIYFIFSRRGCDYAVEDLGDLSLVNEKEASELRRRVEEFLARNPEAVRTHQLDPLLRGIAAHHAGILPTWKGLVEELFQDGLIKVVFATETLAAGINMPARTTVISTLSKRTDRGHRLLTASEFLQMAGRAGRRGMDELGYVVTVQTPFEGAEDAAKLATRGADPLKSQFTPTYGMVLNLLQTHNLEEAKELVECSFGQYIATLDLQPKLQSIEELTRELDKIKAQLAGVDEAVLDSYKKLRDRLKIEQRLLKTLEEQAKQSSAEIAAAALKSAGPLTILSIKNRHIPTGIPLLTVLVEKVPGRGQSPYLVCLSQDNRWYIVPSIDVVALHGELARWQAGEVPVPPPDLTLHGRGIPGTEATALVAANLREYQQPETDPEVEAQQHRVAALQTQLNTHPIHKWGSPSSLLKRRTQAMRLETEIAKSQNELEAALARHWEEFLDLIEILQEMGCLEIREGTEGGNQEEGRSPSAPILDVTELGESAAAIRGDNELWLGLALMSGFLDDLGPHHLAAVCAALVTEVSRPDSATDYKNSPEVEAVLEELWGWKPRRELIKLQYQHSVPLLVLPAKWEDRKLVALVEQWALGIEWPELCTHTSLDEGDVVRMLRRTLDFLSQLPHVPHVAQSMQRNAYRAIQLIDRFPVNETID